MAILTLAMCIGANTAVFTVVYSVLLRPLPFTDSGNILILSNEYPKAGVVDIHRSAGGDYYERIREVPALSEHALYRQVEETIESNGVPEQVHGMAVSPSLFRLLRTGPQFGSPFAEEDSEPNNDQKVILSYALWQQMFAGSPGALGKEFRLSGRKLVITGVMPRNFLFIDPAVRFWVPLALTPQQRVGHHSNNWYHIARLKPGASIQQVEQQVRAVNRANLKRLPQFTEFAINSGFHTKVDRLQEVLVRDVKSTLYLLWAGAGFVLLIGSVNLAGVVLARMNARMKELGTRLALGAGRARIARQLVLENVVTALAGGLTGIGIAALILQLLSTIGLDRLPRAAEVSIDLAAVAFAVAASVLAGGLIAFLPLVRLSAFQLSGILNDGGRGGSSGRRSRAVRHALVVAQVAIAFLLLNGAGLLLASFRELLKVNPGFAMNDQILTVSTNVPSQSYEGAVQLRALMDRSLEAIRQVPGVVSAGATTNVPLSGIHTDNVIMAEDYVMRFGESVIAPMRVMVTPGYLETMSIPLVRGRYFDATDTAATRRVIIVDERLAQKFWPGGDPIGRRMYAPSSADLRKPSDNSMWMTVIGVVRPVRMQDLAGGGNPSGAYYFPFAQMSSRTFTFVIKTARDPFGLARDIRTAIARTDPGLALFEVHTMSERAMLSMAPRRTAMSLSLAFGTLALFLAAVGIYGVVSYMVAQRRREVGIRMAVGSSQSQIFRLFFREGAVLVGAGLVLGILGAAILQKAIETQVYGVRPLEPFVLVPAGLLLAGVALAATVWPARQATKVEPAMVLSD